MRVSRDKYLMRGEIGATRSNFYCKGRHSKGEKGPVISNTLYTSNRNKYGWVRAVGEQHGGELVGH